MHTIQAVFAQLLRYHEQVKALEAQLEQQALIHQQANHQMQRRLDGIEQQMKELKTALSTLSGVAETDLTSLVNSFKETLTSFNELQNPQTPHLFTLMQSMNERLERLEQRQSRHTSLPENTA